MNLTVDEIGMLGIGCTNIRDIPIPIRTRSSREEIELKASSKLDVKITSQRNLEISLGVLWDCCVFFGRI